MALSSGLSLGSSGNAVTLKNAIDSPLAKEKK